MDPLPLKKEDGDVLTLWGGIDVRVIAGPDQAVLEREIGEKLPILQQDGDHIFVLHPSVADSISLKQFLSCTDLWRSCGTYS